MRTVRDEADARRQLREEHRRERDELRVQVTPGARPSGAGSATLVADGTDGIALDPAELAAARKALEDHRQELSRHLEEARRLGDPLADGKGPVAHWMSRSFGLRGGAGAGGVQAALESYLAELESLCRALDTVTAAHGRNDENAAATLSAIQPEAGAPDA